MAINIANTTFYDWIEDECMNKALDSGFIFVEKKFYQLSSISSDKSNHQIVKSELTMMNTLYQRVLYNYDSNNRLAEELWYDYDYYLGLILDYKVAYQYGNDGKLLCEIDSVYDYDFWYFAGQRSYTYSDGNMVQYSSYDDYMFEVERRVYSYDPLQTADQTLILQYVIGLFRGLHRDASLNGEVI